MFGYVPEEELTEEEKMKRKQLAGMEIPRISALSTKTVQQDANNFHTGQGVSPNFGGGDEFIVPENTPEADIIAQQVQQPQDLPYAVNRQRDEGDANIFQRAERTVRNLDPFTGLRGGRQSYNQPRSRRRSKEDAPQWYEKRSDRSLEGGEDNPIADMAAYKEAISVNESGGNYNEIGIEVKGDRAYGKYQIMGNNLPTWTQEALGRQLSPKEFLASPEAQEKVFEYQFGKLVKKYGNPQDAASAWLTGRPLKTGGNAKDPLGTSGYSYVKKFNNTLRQLGKKQRVASNEEADSLQYDADIMNGRQPTDPREEMMDQEGEPTEEQIQQDLLEEQNKQKGVQPVQGKLPFSLERNLPKQYADAGLIKTDAMVDAPITSSAELAQLGILPPDPVDPYVEAQKDVAATDAAYEQMPIADRLSAAFMTGVKNTVYDFPQAIGNLAYMGIDKVLGTDIAKQHQLSLIKTNKYIRDKGLPGAYTNPGDFAARSVQALGQVAVPIPVSGVDKGANIAKQGGRILSEMMLPGTVVRAGESVAPNLFISYAGAVGGGEAAHYFYPPQEQSKQIVDFVDKAIQEEGRIAKEEAINPWVGIPTVMLAAVAPSVVASKAVQHYVPLRTIVGHDTKAPLPKAQSMTTALEAIETISKDSNAVMARQMQKIGKESIADELALVTNSGLELRKAHVLDTGDLTEFSGTTKLDFAPNALVRARDSLPPEVLDEYNKAAQILSIMDDAKAGRAKMPSSYDIEKAREVVARPELRGLVQGNRSITDAILDLSVEYGRITAKEAERLRDKAPNYIHRVLTDDFIKEGTTTRTKTITEKLRTIMSQSITGDGSYDGISALEKRVDFNPIEQTLDVTTSNVSSLAKTLHVLQVDATRKKVINALLDNPEYSKSIRRITSPEQLEVIEKKINYLKKQPQTNEILDRIATLQKQTFREAKDRAITSYWENGKLVEFEVEPLLATALRQDPHKANAWLRAPVKLKQFWTTGYGAVGRHFLSLASKFMETIPAVVMRPSGTSLGVIDDQLQKLTGGKFALRGDLLGTVASSFAASFRAQRAKNQKDLALAIEAAIISNPDLGVHAVTKQFSSTTNVLGMSLDKTIAHSVSKGIIDTNEGIIDAIRQNYYKSAQGWGTKKGALHSTQVNDAREMLGNELSAVTEALKTQNSNTSVGKVWTAYKNIVESMVEGTKLSFIESNLGKVSDTKLANMTRNLTGDAGARGLQFSPKYALKNDDFLGGILTKLAGSTPVTALQQNIMYSNIILQGMSRVGAALKNEPIKTMFGITTAVTLPALSGLGLAAYAGQEYVEYMFNRRENYKKTGSIYFPKMKFENGKIEFYPPEEGHEIRIPQELAMFNYPVLEVLDTIFRLSDQGQQHSGIAGAASDAAKSAFNISLPEYANLALALGNKKQFGIFDNMQSIEYEKDDGLKNYANTSSAFDMITQAVIETVFGASGSAMVASADAFATSKKEKGNVLSAVSDAGKEFASTIYNTKGGLFGKNKYTAFGSNQGLYVNKKTSAIRDITAVSQEINRGSMVTQRMPSEFPVPNVRMGNPGVATAYPPEIAKNILAVAEKTKNNSNYQRLNAQRKGLSTQVERLQAVNQGNVHNYVIVPLTPEEGATAGISYGIYHKDFASAESGLGRPIEEVAKYKRPSVEDVYRSQNDLNKIKYEKDKEMISIINEIEKEIGMPIENVIPR